MAKVALLVDFEPRTRVVVDIPEGMSLEEWMENQSNFDSVAQKARANMLEEIENYLLGENMYWQEDEECPFGTFSSDIE